jgi:spore coat protein U-like protein
MRGSTRGALSFWVLAIVFAMTAQQGWAACSLSVQGVIFGPYDTFSVANLDSTGNIDVTCDIGTLYNVALSAGSGSYASRALRSGPNVLNYNLYVDFPRLLIWGDGTPATNLVNGVGTAAAVRHTLYGRVPSGQNAAVGTYSDSIIVTVNF